MSKYPNSSTLKKAMKDNLNRKLSQNDEKFIDDLSNHFGGNVISCNHRVPQRKAFEIANNVDTEIITECVKLLCSMVDKSTCSK